MNDDIAAMMCPMTDPRITALCRWFEQSQRDLPWRRRRTPYTALVAEAMLQQTQVARVLEKFDAFLKRFPTVEALASADEQQVLAHWQGLGYYRRARNLHAAAKVVIDEFDGAVPAQVDALMRFPGVGRYTAGAIASIVGGQRVPIVDGNIARVLQRWDGDAGAIGEASTTHRCWRRMEELVGAARRPGIFNEAMMELGATICTPKAPQCARCPVSKWCKARKTGRENELPVPKQSSDVGTEHHHAVVIERKRRVLLERRGDDGLWAGLWQPPTIESSNGISARALRNRLPMDVTSIEPCEVFEFRTSSRHVTFHVYRGKTRIRRGRWQPLDRIDEAPMSNAHRKVLRVGLQTEL